jgi:preprotein translocase subunit SecE
MANSTAVTEQEKTGPIKRLQEFIFEVRAEMEKVTWPTKNDLKVSTQVTLLLLCIMAAIIFVFDRVFQILVLGLINAVS